MYATGIAKALTRRSFETIQASLLSKHRLQHIIPPPSGTLMDVVWGGESIAEALQQCSESQICSRVHRPTNFVGFRRGGSRPFRFGLCHSEGTFKVGVSPVRVQMPFVISGCTDAVGRFQAGYEQAMFN